MVHWYLRVMQNRVTDRLLGGYHFGRLTAYCSVVHVHSLKNDKKNNREYQQSSLRLNFLLRIA